MSKTLTTIITILLCISGFVVLFIPELDMNRYSILVKAVTISLLPIISSVGINSAIEKITNKTQKDDKCGKDQTTPQ